MRILIADDHSLFRDGLRSLLASQGHEIVAEARNGREAVALAQEKQPDLVLMDISMPEMDGLTATRQLTSLMPEVKVVILTASEDEWSSAMRMRTRSEYMRAAAATHPVG